MNEYESTKFTENGITVASDELIKAFNTLNKKFGANKVELIYFRQHDSLELKLNGNILLLEVNILDQSRPFIVVKKEIEPPVGVIHRYESMTAYTNWIESTIKGKTRND